MTKTKTEWAIELGATTFTIGGMYLGSTTVPGALSYLIGVTFWFVLCYRMKIWGVMPLNVLTTVVSLLNIWRAL